MASKHLVVCQSCGRQFDANRGGYYNRATRRYTCKACGNQARTGMKQSKAAMIAKIVFGVLFILVGIAPTEPQENPVAFFLTSLLIGGALIAWGLVPYIKVKKNLKRQEEELRQTKRELYRMEKKCPACGAMSKGKYCEYCGEQLID